MSKRISKEAKESIVKKALSRGDKKLAEVASENGVGYSSLTKWIKNSPIQKYDRIPDRAKQFKHLQAIAKLNEAEVGAYCRQHGLYTMQLKEWEKDLMQPVSTDQKYKAEISMLRKKNAELERELRRKEKALAEAAALLILKKKADAIWGEDEDA
jgi:transposase-like protein